jgi:hypothetical protein
MAERLTVEGSFGKFGRCRGVGLRCWARGASGWREGADPGVVVVGVQRNGRSAVRPRRLRGGGKKEAAALRVSRGAATARFRVLGRGTFL